MASNEDAWKRYAHWQGTYRAPLRGVTRGGSPRRARVRQLGVGVLAALAVVVAVSFVVRLVAALAHWDLWALLDVLFAPANAFLLLSLVWVRWPPQTTLAEPALSVRSEPWRTRTVSWGEVVEVQAPGRFDEHPVALLAGGERLPLVALPVAVAEQMAAVTRPVSLPQAGVPGRPVPDQEGFDGPFRRGRSAR